MNVGQKYSFRINAVNKVGQSKWAESDDIKLSKRIGQLGTFICFEIQFVYEIFTYLESLCSNIVLFIPVLFVLKMYVLSSNMLIFDVLK